MTKRDFFILLIKVFGLYSIILTLFSPLPQNISFALSFINLSSILWIILVTGFTLWLLKTLLFNTDKVVKFLRLDKGFDDDRIEIGNLDPSTIIKLGTFIIGGFLIIDNIPNFLSHTLFSFKAEVVGYEYASKQYFHWAVSGVNILIGLFLFIKYDFVARMFKVEKRDSKKTLSE